MQILSEQELLRREKRKSLEALGINPYPAQLYPVNITSKEIKEGYTDEKADEYKEVCLAGRLMSCRISGAASFAEIQDKDGRIQLYFRRDDICPGEDKSMYNNVFKKLVDIGDLLGIKGYVFTTNVGETTVYVTEFTILSKSLKPLPVVKTDESGKVHDAVTDPEMRYRQRYVDLVVNPQVKDTFLKRTKIMNTMRNFFNDNGWLEVETPVLQSIHGGAAARPFMTHHNALDIPLYLRIANELYLKRLIVGGFDGVYEFGKMFRNEGMDRTHNPEFTSMEIYVAYKDYIWMMDMTEKLIEEVCMTVNGKSKVMIGEDEVDFQGPYKRISMFDSIKEYTDVDVSKMDEEELRATCKELNVEIDETMGKGKLIDAIFGDKVEEHLIQPTFITDYPVEMTPLAKKHRTEEGLVERFELFVTGKEIANAYSELNDPIDQRQRLEGQLELAERGDDEAMAVDDDFLRALEYGMPPTAGLGIGIDRLTMMMTNELSIQDVLFFPQMKPEKKPVIASVKDFEEQGVRAELVPIIQKIGIYTIDDLKDATAAKLFNDVCGMRKKMKLKEVKNPSKDEVEGWLA